MDLTLLIQSGMGLLVLLGLLVFILVLSSSKKKKEVQKSTKATQNKLTPKPKTELNYLRDIIKNRKSTAAELKEALELVIKHHGTIHKKLGLRPHPESDIYMEIIFTICRHPNTNKDIILRFDKDLERKNPEYKKEINDALTKGLNSRGA
jgi:hypothetical protein